MHLSIELTQEQHQQLKDIAALRGQNINDFVLERVLQQPLPKTVTTSEIEALQQLDAFLQPRVEAAKQDKVVNKSVQQIFNETYQKELL
ncbi:MAG: DUF1778 domain-containing protein [Methylococcales bacterium]